MKAKEISELDYIENNHNLVATKKWNGFSETITIKNGKATVHSTRSGADHSKNVPCLTTCKFPEDIDIVLHSEGIASTDKVEDAKSIFGSLPETAIARQKTHGEAQFVLFDVIELYGLNIENLPFARRHQLVGQWFSILLKYTNCLKLEFLVTKNKKQYFEELIASGAEGVVIKDLMGTNKDVYKVKKIKSWDVIITGFTEGKGKYTGLIGALQYGFYNNGKVEYAGKAAGMVDEQRKVFSNNRNQFIGKVVEIKGQEIGNQGGIVFPRFVRVRDDKPIELCILEK
ncbi:MAG: hypothetical protein Q7R78_00080 [bacterium]|nr:hypothetical protein [bacterium]